MEKLEKGEGIGGVVVVVEHEGGQPVVCQTRLLLWEPPRNAAAAAWCLREGAARCCPRWLWRLSSE